MTLRDCAYLALGILLGAAWPAVALWLMGGGMEGEG